MTKRKTKDLLGRRVAWEVNGDRYTGKFVTEAQWEAVYPDLYDRVYQGMALTERKSIFILWDDRTAPLGSGVPDFCYVDEISHFDSMTLDDDGLVVPL